MPEIILVRNCGELITGDPHCQDAIDDPQHAHLGLVRSGAVLLEGGRVVWAGSESRLDTLGDITPNRVLDAMGRVVLPGLVDAHTHLVFAGSRVPEFGLRCAGASYEEIARSGGGIAVTTAATRNATEEELVASARVRLQTMLTHGTTTVEIKSGYGLTTADELKMLRVIRRLAAEVPQRIVATFLGAHIVAPEFRADPERYVDMVVNEMLPEVAAQELADYCDVFCETTAFSVEQSQRILERAADLGLGLRLHSEQLHRTGGTALGVALGADSVDHLEWVNDEDCAQIAASDTVATLLPGATLFLGEDRWAPARRLLNAGARVALATDCNPGSCMTEHLPLIGTLGCVRLGMSPAEALLGITTHAAASLGLQSESGQLTRGARADLALADVSRYEELFYHYGVNHVTGVVCDGRVQRWPE